MQSHNERAEEDGTPSAASEAVLLIPEVSTPSLHQGFLERRENPPPPPSSVHGEIDEDDNWSRQLVGAAQVSGGEDYYQSNEEGGNGDDGVGVTLNDSNDEGRNEDQNAMADARQQRVLTPQQPELTLKEKLVLRERQRRIETERARLKRQFALSETNEADEDVLDDERTNDEILETQVGISRENDDAISNINSIGDEGTLGEESTKAHPDEEESTNDGSRTLGFNMERFLRNSETFCPELATTHEQSAESGAVGDQGVVMERFLNAPMVVANTSGNLIEAIRPTSFSSTDRLHEDSAARLARTDVNDGRGSIEEHDQPNTEREPHRSVSFDVDALATRTTDRMLPARQSDATLDLPDDSREAMAGSRASIVGDIGVINAMTSNASMQSELSIHDQAYERTTVMDRGLTYSASMEMQVDVTSSHGDALSNASDEPRVLRLTEADMLEMAAIDEVSIGNAPPSDRDDEEILSEIGELADFGNNYRLAHGDTTISQDTPTTAVESVSQHSGHQSQRSAHVGTSVVSNSSVDHLDALHTSDHHSMSGVEGIPSARDRPHYLLSPGAASVAANPPSVRGRDDDIDDRSATRDTDGISLHDHEGEHGREVQLIFEESIDRVPELPFGSRDDARQVDNTVAGLLNRPRHSLMSQSVDESIDSETQGMVVDGFDFDKNAPRSPFLRGVFVDSIRDLPDDSSSPSEFIDLSPLHGSYGLDAMGGTAANSGNVGYGGVDDSMTRRDGTIIPNLPSLGRSSKDSTEEEPLIVRALDEKGQAESVVSTESAENASRPQFMRNALDKVFSRLRSGSKVEKNPSQNESDTHVGNVAFSKVFSTRQLPILLTIVLELPLLWMISGGADAGCQRVGRKHYHLLLAFLPLTCAVSGSVGHQSSTLVSRVISSGVVTSETFVTWFGQDVRDTAVLAISIGAAVGVLGFIVGEADFAFGLALCVAQAVSTLVAGVTGTLTPLFACCIFESDSERWIVPFVSCLQDIVGCTMMVVISYRILAMLGPGEQDACW